MVRSGARYVVPRSYNAITLHTCALGLHYDLDDESNEQRGNYVVMRGICRRDIVCEITVPDVEVKRQILETGTIFNFRLHNTQLIYDADETRTIWTR